VWVENTNGGRVVIQGVSFISVSYATAFISYEGRFSRHILVRATVLSAAIGRTRGIIEFCGLAMEIN